MGSDRNIKLAVELGKMDDDCWVGSEEMAAITGYSLNSIRQRKVKLPTPDPRSHRLKWRLGNVRTWLRAPGEIDKKAGKKKRGGRPTKVEQLRAAAGSA